MCALVCVSMGGWLVCANARTYARMHATQTTAHRVISNCVINLSPDKEAVLQGTYDALREGGELYFSDVYSDRRIPEAVRQHKVLWGECLSGTCCMRARACDAGESVVRLGARSCPPPLLPPSSS